MTTKIGVQLHPQDTTVADLRQAWTAADALGVDSLWVWDHFYPLYGDPDASHFEAYTLLTTMAADTSNATIGALVSCFSYRNPNLLADLARTIDHVSGGRFVLGLGSGWFERDYDEFGYEFGTAIERLHALRDGIPVVKERLAKLNPPPVGPMPLMIGGSGEKVTLKIVATEADAWNFIGTPEEFAAKNAILDDWCEQVGRDPEAIERSVLLMGADWKPYVEAGADHLIFGAGAPFDLDPVVAALDDIRA